MKFVLIVSRELSVQESLRMILKDDFSVFQASTGDEALLLASQHPIDLVLLDTNLPEHKGLSLPEKLRGISEDTAFLIITTSRTPDLEALGERGFAEILVKPFEREEVRWAIRKALEFQRLMRENRMLKGQREANGSWGQRSAPQREEASSGQGLGAAHPAGREVSPMQYALKEFFKALTHITDLDRLLDFILHAIADVFQINKACIALQEPAKSHYRVRASLGIEESRLKSLAFKVGQGLPWWFLRYNQILHKEDADRLGFLREGVLVNEELEALDAKIAAPLLTKGKLVGIISLGNKVTGRPFHEGDVDLLSMIANYTAIAVENSLLYRELSLQKRYSENILKSIGSGVVAIDTVGRVTTYNPTAERILGLPREETLGRNIQKLGSVFADVLLRTLEGNQAFCRYEVSHPMTKAPLGTSTSLLRDDSNRIKGAIMIFTDLTESKELEAKTRALESLRFWSTLANRMAQEIRNPLVAVKTFAQLLPERYQDEEFRRNFFQVVTGEIDRLNKITESLLEFAQPRENRFGNEDVNEIIDLVIQSRAQEIASHHTRLVKQVSSERLYVRADRAHLAKAIGHLIDNSLEAMPDTGRLRIRTKRAAPASPNGKLLFRARDHRTWVEIEIEDTGGGIPSDHLNEIFSPFFTTKIKGMGFGLPIAQRIIQDHQGRIEVQTEPGKGSKFRILLPLNGDGEARPAVNEPALSRGKSHG